MTGYWQDLAASIRWSFLAGMLGDKRPFATVYIPKVSDAFDADWQAAVEEYHEKNRLDMGMIEYDIVLHSDQLAPGPLRMVEFLEITVEMCKTLRSFWETVVASSPDGTTTEFVPEEALISITEEYLKEARKGRSRDMPTFARSSAVHDPGTRDAAAARDAPNVPTTRDMAAFDSPSLSTRSEVGAPILIHGPQEEKSSSFFLFFFSSGKTGKSSWTNTPGSPFRASVLRKG